MRHYFANDSHPKSVAKALRTELARFGHKQSHSESLALVARMFGYRNWSELLQFVGNQPPSPDDTAVGQETAAARMEYHVEAMVTSGFERSIAVDVVKKIGPTSKGKARVPVPPSAAWASDEGVSAYLRNISIQIAGDASDIVSLVHKNWIGFRVRFDRSQVKNLNRSNSHGGFVFCISNDAMNVVFREGHRAEEKLANIIDRRLANRARASTDRWEFILDYNNSMSQGDFSDGARIIWDVLSRLDASTLRALRCRLPFREEHYEAVARSHALREFMHEYPALADAAIWLDKLPLDHKDRPLRERINDRDPLNAVMFMLGGGQLPKGKELATAKDVAQRLRGYDVVSAGNDLFGLDALKVLGHLGSVGIPSSPQEMKALIKAADRISELIAHYGMDFERAYASYKGSWADFQSSLLVGPNQYDVRMLWADTFKYLITSAFGHTYGIDPDVLYDNNFGRAVVKRLCSLLMAQKPLVDIARLGDVIARHPATTRYHLEERYPSLGEADELMSLMTLAMPAEYHGKRCCEVLKTAGYELDALAGMLKLEPDLEFDDHGLPILEARFVGLPPETYSAAPLEQPGFRAPAPRLATRPIPTPPPRIPPGPTGWRWEAANTNQSHAQSCPEFDGATVLENWLALARVGMRTGWGLQYDGEARCPVRLGRFDTLESAAKAIKGAKGLSG